MTTIFYLRRQFPYLKILKNKLLPGKVVLNKLEYKLEGEIFETRLCR